MPDLVRTFTCPPELRAVLGGVGVCLHPELAHGLGAQGRVGRAARRTVREVVHEGAVDQVHVRPRVLAIHARAQAMGHHGAAISEGVGDDSGLKEDEVGVVAAVQRKRCDRTLGYEVPELTGAGVHAVHAGGDRHLLGDAARLEGEAHHRRLAHYEHDPRLHRGPEARHLGPYLVGAHGELRQDEGARRVGGAHALEAGLQMAGCHGGPRKGRAGRVDDLPGQGSRGVSLGAGHAQEEEHAQKSSSHPRLPSPRVATFNRQPPCRTPVRARMWPQNQTPTASRGIEEHARRPHFVRCYGVGPCISCAGPATVSQARLKSVAARSSARPFSD